MCPRLFTRPESDAGLTGQLARVRCYLQVNVMEMAIDMGVLETWNDETVELAPGVFDSTGDSAEALQPVHFGPSPRPVGYGEVRG